MEFLKSAKQRSLLSTIVYYVLNLGLVGILFAMSQTVQYPAAAIILVLMSKWRTLLVRPKFWWTNIRASLVDVIVGLGVVVLMYAPQADLYLQVGLAVFYAVWLIVLKPLSKRWQMALQAAVALVIGVSALFVVSHDWPAVVVVALVMLIGYSTARHYLSTYEEAHITLLSATMAVIFGELGWLAHYWTFGYPLLGISSLALPQITIILLCVAFLAERVYVSHRRRGAVVLQDVLGPAILVFALILTMLIFLNSVEI